VDQKTITLTWDKETDKGKQRFVAAAGGAITGTLYLTKEEAGDRKILTITVK
jgi:hypothetical protein